MSSEALITTLLRASAISGVTSLVRSSDSYNLKIAGGAGREEGFLGKRKVSLTSGVNKTAVSSTGSGQFSFSNLSLSLATDTNIAETSTPPPLPPHTRTLTKHNFTRES